MKSRSQFWQTIISTASVGAILGSILPLLATVAFVSDYGNNAPVQRSLFAMAADLVLYFSICVGFCVLFFGLVPMAIQHGFVWVVSKFTGRA